jgi:hypothetical protein
MADGRMWLNCKCGERFLLAKRHGGAYFVRSASVDEAAFEQRFDSFLSNHFQNCAYKDDDTDTDIFEMDYE